MGRYILILLLRQHHRILEVDPFIPPSRLACVTLMKHLKV